MSIPHSTAENTSSEKDKESKTAIRPMIITTTVHRLQKWKLLLSSNVSPRISHLPACGRAGTCETLGTRLNSAMDGPKPG